MRISDWSSDVCSSDLDSLVRYIGEQLTAHGVPGEYLALQLPEAKVFTHLKAAQEFAAAIGKLDCRIPLEQFGAGLDSFQLLAHLKPRSEEHTSELQSLMRSSYAVFCLTQNTKE